MVLSSRISDGIKNYQKIYLNYHNFCLKLEEISLCVGFERDILNIDIPGRKSCNKKITHKQHNRNISNKTVEADYQTVATLFLKLVSENARYGCLQAAKMSLRASLQSLLEAHYLYIAS